MNPIPRAPHYCQTRASVGENCRAPIYYTPNLKILGLAVLNENFRAPFSFYDGTENISTIAMIRSSWVT